MKVIKKTDRVITTNSVEVGAQDVHKGQPLPYSDGMRPVRRLRFFLILIMIGVLPSSLHADEDSNPVKVYYQLNSDDSYSFFADSQSYIPSYLDLRFPVLKNLSSSEKIPFEAVIPAGAKQVKLFDLKPGNGQSVEFKYQVTFALGDPISVKPDETYLYLFPFEHGQKFFVGQGFNGKFSHFGQNQFAVDFTMPEGTGIYAARSGIVVGVKEDSNLGGAGPSFDDKGNYVLIYHADGTFGNYVHLKQNGAIVDPGQSIEAGDLLGYSGNTGRTTGPHLHFDVRVPRKDGTMSSIPVKFLNYDASAVVPQFGNYYYSLHPGMPAFKVVLGRLLKNDDFKGYISTVGQSDQPGIRRVDVDGTIVLYLSNGLSRSLDFDIRFRLTNLASSAGNPIKLRVPERSELFLTLLNPLNAENDSRYEISFSYQ